MQALRQYHSSREASLERQVQAAQSHAAQVEAAQEHRTQEQFVDDCLKVQGTWAPHCKTNMAALTAKQIKREDAGQLYVADKEGPGEGGHCLRGQGDLTSEQCS